MFGSFFVRHALRQAEELECLRQANRQALAQQIRQSERVRAEVEAATSDLLDKARRGEGRWLSDDNMVSAESFLAYRKGGGEPSIWMNNYNALNKPRGDGVEWFHPD